MSLLRNEALALEDALRGVTLLMGRGLSASHRSRLLHALAALDLHTAMLRAALRDSSAAILLTSARETPSSAGAGTVTGTLLRSVIMEVLFVCQDCNSIDFRSTARACPRCEAEWLRRCLIGQRSTLLSIQPFRAGETEEDRDAKQAINLHAALV